MGPASRARYSVSGRSSSSQAASGTRATCTGRTNLPLPQASAASTGWTHRAARGLPSRLVSVRAGRRAGGGRGTGPVPAPAHGAFSPLPGVRNHSYCRNPDQDPRGPWCYISGEAGAPEKRTCEDLRCPGTHWRPEGAGDSRAPAPRAAWERPLRPPRTCGRAAPASSAPPPRHPIGQGCLQAAGPKARWPPPPFRVSSSSAGAL